jgi:hypothetical protein
MKCFLNRLYSPLSKASIVSLTLFVGADFYLGYCLKELFSYTYKINDGFARLCQMSLADPRAISIEAELAELLAKSEKMRSNFALGIITSVAVGVFLLLRKNSFRNEPGD